MPKRRRRKPIAHEGLENVSPPANSSGFPKIEKVFLHFRV